MNVSNPSAFFGLVFSACVLLVLAAGEVAGQEHEGPLRLIPSQQNGQDAAGASPSDEAVSVPDLEATVESEGDPPEQAVTEPASDGIVVGTLDAIEPAAVEPDPIGILLPEIMPFPVDSWSESRRSRIETLMPRLPVAPPSLTMRRLALKLLTSPAHPPAGPGEPGAFAALRAERLAAMGARDHAVALLDRIEPAAEGEAIARIENDRWLASLDYDAACRRVSEVLNRSGDVYWRRARILCQARAGRLEAATLGLELLRESDAAPDPAFDDTIYAMAGLAEPVVVGLDKPTPLRIATLRLAQIPIPAEAIESAAPDLLPAIAGAPESPPLMRLLAAERAEAAGVLSTESLRETYLEMAFSPVERARALQMVESLEPPLSRSLMLQSIEAETVPTMRAELLAVALSLAEEQGAYATMARALAQLVRTIPVVPEHGWFGGTAGRALIAANDLEVAKAWHELLVEQSSFNAEAAPAMRRLWPLVLLRGDQSSLTSTTFQTWLAQETAHGNATSATARANWLVVLLDALGYGVDPEVWDRLLADEQSVEMRAPAPALAHGLRTAAEHGRLGETVLMALLALGSGGPAKADLATVGLVVSSLVSVGLQEDAQAIALEAALAAGL